MLPRLLALDLDGTLFDGRQQVSERNLAALQQARRAGMEICIATGRRHTFAWRNLSARALLPGDVIISSNGAVVRLRDGRLVQRTQLQREHSLALCGLVGEHRSHLVFTFDKVDQAPLADRHAGSLLIESAAALTGSIARWVEENRADIVERSPIEAGLAKEMPIQAMVVGKVAPMRAFERAIQASRLAEDLAVHRTEYAHRDLAIVDLLPAGCSKGAALEHLARLRGLQRGQVAAIGDNFNDSEMLRFAGRSFVPANSAPEVLQAAAAHGWGVVASNDEDGVAAAIAQMLAGN